MREWQTRIFEVMARAPWHTYILLTKRPENIRSDEFGVMSDELGQNLWLGVTAENREMYAARFPLLMEHRAAVRFVSVEPMLHRVGLAGLWQPDWVICGPETGPGARWCDPRWISFLAERCDEYGVPFFDKREEWIRREFPSFALLGGG